MPKMIEFSVNL